MASPMQQQTLQRKILYIGLIVALFTLSGAFRAYVVEPKAEALALKEQNVGDVELGGSALRLSLTGSRGVVVCALWNWANDAQKKGRWNELDLYVRSLTKLQPHFITPWLFQSWNLAYNVAVEADQVRDKYFYVARGVQLLAEGERQNRNHPDLRYYLGFYQQHKIGQSDETNMFRSLWQMSCMRPFDRDPQRFYTEESTGGRREINRAVLEKFCQENPQFVRRLRDKLRVAKPEELVQFLDDNKRLPTLYIDNPEEAGPAWTQGEAPLRPLPERFPVMPPRQAYDPAEITYDNIDRMNDRFCCFTAARAWYGYAQDPLPPTRKDQPGRPEDITDPVHQRLPSYTTALFRNAPPRAQSYVAERLEAEGWFDADGWLIPDWFPSDRFSDGRPARVGTDQNWAAEAWDAAHRMWERLGRESGLLMTPIEETNLREQAWRYLEENGLPKNLMPPEPKDLSPTDPRYQDYLAAVKIRNYAYYRDLTNFPHHYHGAEVERKPETILARKAFFEADRLRLQGLRAQALRRYEAPDALVAWRKILGDNKNFAQDPLVQEDSYEVQLRYTRLTRDIRGRLFRDLLNSVDALALGGLPPGPGWGLPAVVNLAAAPDMALPDIEPDQQRRLDSPGPDGEPLVSDNVVHQVKVRLGIIKPAPVDEARMRATMEAGPPAVKSE